MLIQFVAREQRPSSVLVEADSGQRTRNGMHNPSRTHLVTSFGCQALLSQAPPCGCLTILCSCSYNKANRRIPFYYSPTRPLDKYLDCSCDVGMPISPNAELSRPMACGYLTVHVEILVPVAKRDGTCCFWSTAEVLLSHQPSTWQSFCKLALVLHRSMARCTSTQH